MRSASSFLAPMRRGAYRALIAVAAASPLQPATAATAAAAPPETVAAPRPAYCAQVPAASVTLPGATTSIYRTAGGRPLRIHVFAAAGKAARNPAALFFFGGGFRVGDAASFAELAKAFAARGYVAAVADYRVLCRDGQTAIGGVDDAEAALVWLRAHATALHVDPRRITLVGGSAGGLLAASAALRVPPAQRPAALVLFNPVLDLETGMWARDQSAAQAIAYSPSRLAVSALPPTIIFHGTADKTVPIASSREFCARALAQDRTCTLVEYAGKDHSFSDSHENDPALGTSAYADTSERAFRFLQPINRPAAPGAIGAGDRYVAMGSSFAAGPGLPPETPGRADRCARSSANYAHLLARRLDLALTDVSCGGATTAHILGPWKELAPQIDAVTPDTRLVTITIGGNDVGYVGSLIKASMCAKLDPAPAQCGQSPAPTEQAWSSLERALHAIVGGIRQRAPTARIVFVDYVTLLPRRGGCATLPFPAAQADAARAIGAHLKDLTARVAVAEGVEDLQASTLTQDHDACAKQPWVNGWTLARGATGVQFHPNAAGMAAIADALAHSLADGRS